MRNKFIVSEDLQTKAKELLSFIKRYYQIKKQKGCIKASELFPSFQTMQKTFKLNTQQTKALLRELENMGEIERKVSKYYLSDGKKKEEKKQEKKVLNIPKLTLQKMTIFRIIICIVFIAFYYMGVKYNYIGFSKSKSTFDSIISAIGFFTFGIVMFECFILFFLQKNPLWIIFLVLFGFIFTNNFINILSGQFEKYQEYSFSNSYIENRKNNELLSLYQKQEKELEIELQNRITERDRQYKKLEIDNNKQSTNIIWSITHYEIPRIEKKLNTIRQQKEELLKIGTIQEQKITIYQYISNILKQDNQFANSLALLHLIIPSFIIDVIASISLALLFFLKKL